MNNSWMGFSRSAVAAAVAIVIAAPALAQNTTAAVGGRVTGGDGSPIAGASVVINHPASGSTVTATTDAEGRYVARGLRVGGPYTITFTKGSLTDKQDNVFLTLAETTALDSVLGGATTQIVVTGQGGSGLNRWSMGSGTKIGSREIATQASIQRNVQDYARNDPRLAQTDKERGEISAGGQNTRFNSITIDGVTTNDTFGLEANNLPTLKQPISIDAIESIQVNLSNYDVTQRGYTGANINAVTKSGTNEFHGSVYYVWRDEALAGDRYNRTNNSYFEAPPFSESTIGFNLGGPIIQDKLFFFGSYEEFKSSRASPDFGPLGSQRTNVGISQPAIDQAIAISKNTYGIDVGTSEVPTGLEVVVKDTLLKLDWNITNDHRASLRYTKTVQDEPNIVGFSGTGLSTSSWWFNQAKEVESVVGQWFADWTPTFSTEVKLSKRDYESRPTPVNGTRLPAIGLRFSGALPDFPTVNANNRFLNMGTELSRHLNVLETETTDLYFGGTLALGAHEMKFGADYSNNDVYNAFLQNVNGNYTFGCEPGTYSFGTFSNCNLMTPTQREQATLENYANGRPSAYTLQSAVAGRTLDDAVAIWSVANTGGFVQDSWKVSPTLNLLFGLRLDQQKVPTKPIANPTVAMAKVNGSIAGSSYTRDSGGFGMDNTETLDGNTLVQPRFGFNWDLGNPETRRQVRGGFGLFQGAAANVWLSNPFSNTGMAVAQRNCASFTACATAGVRFSADPDSQPVLTNTPPAPNVDILSPNLEQPSVWKTNLAFETELPSFGLGPMTGSVEWLHTKTNSAIYYKQLNLGGITARGSDGREMYYRSEGLNANCWNADGSPITSGACATPTGQSRTRALSNPNFNNVFLAEKTDMGGGDAFTVGIARPITGGWGWSLAYTRTNMSEVSPLTSSTSSSNFGNRNIFNPNEEVTSNSNYLVRDRFNGSFSWGKAFIGDYRTSVGVFYEGRRGKPYSWTYLNDINGDGLTGNDLMYIPTGPGSGEVTFRGRNATETSAQAEAAFWDVVNGNQGLSSAKGGIVGRNNNYAPWVNNFDVRLNQELPGFAAGHRATVTFDILNFGNLLNKKWGRIDEIGFPSNRSFVNYAGLDSSGRYIYTMGSVEDYTTRQVSGESQWAMQITLKYAF